MADQINALRLAYNHDHVDVKLDSNFISVNDSFKYELFNMCEINSIELCDCLKKKLIDETSDAKNVVLLWACENGSLELIELIHLIFGLTVENIKKDNNRSIVAACINKHLDIIIYLHTHFGLNANDFTENKNIMFRRACENGDLPMVTYMHEEIGFTRSHARTSLKDALRLSCSIGHIHILKYLHQHFHLTNDDIHVNNNQAIKKACENGHLNIVEYLFEQFGRSQARSCLNYAIKLSCNSNILNYLHSICNTDNEPPKNHPWPRGSTGALLTMSGSSCLLTSMTPFRILSPITSNSDLD
jgi:hypothetical protein